MLAYPAIIALMCADHGSEEHSVQQRMCNRHLLCDLHEILAATKQELCNAKISHVGLTATKAEQFTLH